MKYDLKYLSVPLPEDVEKLKLYGDFNLADKLIENLLSKDIPKALRKRLEIEKDIIKVVGVNEYPFDEKKAIEMMKSSIENFEDDELEELREKGAVDWIYIDGKVHYQRRFLQNLFKVNPEYKDRNLEKKEDSVQSLRKNELDENIEIMKEKGSRKVKITLRSSIGVKEEFEKVGENVRVHLPIPRATREISNIKILDHSEEVSNIDVEDSPQRTIFFETKLQKDKEFFVEYSYINDIKYVKLDPEKSKPSTNKEELQEEYPHIAFTPYLKLLLEEILEGETNLIICARKIYDFVTTKVMYSFMREYFTIDNISEYAAVNQKGDCGVQAILFITLCRMCGIPAKWQSGLYVSKAYTGCHDWAEFYVEPYGWVFADLSFGGSAWREGNYERWNYYFGNLDIFRMPANSKIQFPFANPKKHLRADPIDNQRGEFEYDDEGLLYAHLNVKQELVDIEEL